MDACISPLLRNITLDRFDFAAAMRAVSVDSVDLLEALLHLADCKDALAASGCDLEKINCAIDKRNVPTASGIQTKPAASDDLSSCLGNALIFVEGGFSNTKTDAEPLDALCSMLADPANPAGLLLKSHGTKLASLMSRARLALAPVFPDDDEIAADFVRLIEKRKSPRAI